MNLPEKNRRWRGHSFYPPKGSVPPMRAQENEKDPVIYAHYFGPSMDAWITEYDPETGEAFGYVRFAVMPDGAEWGYLHLPEYEAANMIGFGVVERDLYFGPRPASEIPEIGRRS